MKKLSIALLSSVGFVPGALAGPGGFSTVRIDWTASAAAAGSGAQAIPTLGTYGALLLAVLLALVVYRVSRKRDLWIRALAPFATFGLAASGMFMAESPEAGLVVSNIQAAACSGSQTYTAGVSPPPCFVNNCGSPVTVSYTFLNGEDPFGDPIASCSFQYFCDGSPNPATQGSSVPSDGQPYQTAYCTEIGAGGPT